jgi:hypothetical protein
LISVDGNVSSGNSALMLLLSTGYNKEFQMMMMMMMMMVMIMKQ